MMAMDGFVCDSSGFTFSPPMCKQYYFSPSPRGLLAWDVDRLVELAAHLPRKRIPLSQVRELDANWTGDDEPFTWRTLVEHVRLMDEADLSYPIILSATGAVMDGRSVPDLDDINGVVPMVMKHRVVMNFQAEAEGVTVDKLITL